MPRADPVTSLYSLAHLRDMPAATWDALVPAGQPFLSHAFLSAMEDSGSVARTTGWAAEHLVLEHEGKVQALLPGYRKWHSYGEYVFDHGWADACERAGIAYYPKWLGAVPFSPVSGPRLLTADPAAGHLLLQALPEYLSKAALSGAHINFTEPALDVQMARLPGWMERLGCQFHWQNRGYRDFQDFLDTLSSRKRKQMRKEREQVAGQGIDFRWYRGDELDEAQWDFVYLCYANTYAVRGRAPYLTREFFSLLAERMPHALRVVMARQAGRDVAMALSLVGGDSFFGRYWGCLA
ncbi:MAG TPA: GNAT family N-acetyltransferase, partial [Pseudomonas sp.]|nr:GNAT family N-acetyltransferase [Pseudomonas sp.]